MTPEAQQLDPLLQFFAYEHLPDRLREISAPFGVLALNIVTTLPRNPERTMALRKLLEAKDCAVRARIFREFMGAGMMAPNAKPEPDKQQADRPPPGEIDWQREKFEQAVRARVAEIEAGTNTALPPPTPAAETYTALPPTTPPPTAENTDKPDTPTG